MMIDNLYYLALTPPHANKIATKQAATLLNTSLAELGVMLNYPAATLVYQSGDKENLLDLADNLSQHGISSKPLEAKKLFSIPEALPANQIDIQQDSLILSSIDNVHKFSLAEPLQITILNIRKFGSEYRKHREKLELKKDKKRKRESSEFKALLSIDSSNNSSTDQTPVWIFSQFINKTLVRAALNTGKIEFSFLAEKMELRTVKNLESLKENFKEKCSDLTLEEGLTGVNYRYPFFIDPSFVQVLASYGYNKDSYSAETLAERLLTTLWAYSQ